MLKQHLRPVRSLSAEAADYLIFKQKRLTPKSQRGYHAVLKKLAEFYPDLVLADFDPPAGTQRIEEFLNAIWGARSARTYNKSFSIVHDFMEWQLRRGKLKGDPMLPLERARTRPIHRTTFSEEQCAAILIANPEPRQRVALRLLLYYGIRKGALQGIRFEHFDPHMRRLVVFTKGEKIHQLPIPEDGLWSDLAEIGEPGHHYLLPKQTQRRRRPPHRRDLERIRALLAEAQQLANAATADTTSAREAHELADAIDLAAGWLDRTHAAASIQVRRFFEEEMGEHGLHDWWYRCLARAGVVAPGVTRGQRMHKARHTSGQRILDATGNLKAAQKVLGHANISTTGNHYLDWDIDQTAETLRTVIAGTT